MNGFQTNRADGRRDREGVALVIVLGILSVLVIMGIAFSITTKTERTATRAYVDVVRARQMTHTALNRVIGEHINGRMNNLVYPSAENEAFSSGTDTDTNNIVLHLGDRSIYSGAIFVPMSMRQAAFAADGARWIELRDQDNNLQGEYSFLVINNTGLLDAMVIGNREGFDPARRRGADPGEIRFSPAVLPEVRTGVSLNYLNTNRAMFGRFESVAELYYLLSSADSSLAYRGDPLLRQLNDNPPSMADHLHVFSRFPFGYANDDLSENTNIGFIGGDPTGWDTNAIISALNDIDGNPIPDIPAFVRVMQDFASEDYELFGNSDAEKFERISSKRVPMINEVIVSNQLTYTAAVAPSTQGTLRHTVFVTVETWYPFNDSGPEQFVVEYGINPADVPFINMITPPYPALGAGGTYQRDAAFTPAPFVGSSSPYRTHTFAFFAEQTVGAPNPPAPPPTVSVPWNVNVTIDDPIRVVYPAGSSPTVDLVSSFNTNNVAVSATLSAGAPVNLGATALSANDPRINWDATSTLQYQTAAPTPGTNNVTLGSTGNADETGVMFSKMEPFETAGELGFLLFDASRPWTTLRVAGSYPSGYPAQATRVFDRLSVFPASDFPRRGLVNPNSRQTNSLIAAFFDAPIERFPDTTWPNDLTAAQATAIVGDLLQNIQSDGGITNRSHLIDRIDAGALDSILDISNDKFTRESVVRNSMELFNPRHGLFTIFVAARVFSDAYEPSNPQHSTNRYDYVTGEQRAMAVVWRDPYATTDAAGNDTHESWVQYFHWFSGAFEN